MRKNDCAGQTRGSAAGACKAVVYMERTRVPCVGHRCATQVGRSTTHRRGAEELTETRETRFRAFFVCVFDVLALLRVQYQHPFFESSKCRPSFTPFVRRIALHAHVADFASASGAASAFASASFASP
eukprot:scaffold83_cov246-Pinguiococcus_pyrenoidosus.AAC.9